MFLWILSILFEYSIKALEWLKGFNPVLLYFALYGSLAYKWVLSISGCWLIRLNNESVFLDPEPPVVSILYVW